MYSSLPQTLYPAVPVNLPQLQSQGRRLLEQARTLVLSPAIRTKTVIGLGGCFSSGKSSLVNAVASRRLLPTEIVPTTACPTYVVKGSEEKVILCNRFFTRSSLSLSVLPQLTHGYYAADEEGEQPQDLSHLVRDPVRIRFQFSLFQSGPAGYPWIHWGNGRRPGSGLA